MGRQRPWTECAMSWEPELEELRRRQALVGEMGGEEGIARWLSWTERCSK